MKIITDEIKIPKTETVTTQYVENQLGSRGIVPLRWAIVKKDAQNFVVNVSYCKENDV